MACGALGCAPAATHHPQRSDEPLAPVRAAPTLASPRTDAGPVGDAASDAFPEASPDAAEAALPLPIDRVQIERPHKLYERPRPSGAVAAAGADELLARWNVGGTGEPDFVSSRPSYHPGARVRVDTRVLSGTLPVRLQRNRRTGRYPNVLSQTSLLARSRKYGYWPFRICFEDGLREDQRLKGKTAIRMTIDGRGRVVAARLASTKLEDASVAQCLVDRSRALTFPPPPRGRAIRVETTIALWPGDAPVLRVGPPRGETHENPGQLDDAKLRSALDALKPDLARCYATGLARDPALWGRIALRLDVSEAGKLGPVREYESRFPDRVVRRCVVQHVRNLALGRPKGGAVSLIVAIRFGTPPTPASEAGKATDERADAGSPALEPDASAK